MAAVARPMKTPARTAFELDQQASATAARATARRSQLIVELRARQGARANSSASQGRRRWVREIATTATTAQAISRPALITQNHCSCCWPVPPPGVSQAATCMNRPVSTGYSRYCMSGDPCGILSTYGCSPSAKPRPVNRCGMSL